MARIRSIHPGLWTDEAFVSLSPMARLLLIGMWNECDDQGLFVWSPLQMKMRVLPADNVDAAALMAELEAAGFIRRYEVAGKAYGAVRNFRKFQRPKKPNPVHPITPEISAFVGTSDGSGDEGSEEVPHQFPTSGRKSPQMEDGGGNRSSVSNETGRAPASDKKFWDDAKAYLGGKGSLIGKWCRDYGQDQTAKAITAAQLERAVEPVSYIEKVLRLSKARATDIPVC